MPLTLPELIDVLNLQKLMDRFYAATGIPVGIIGSDGEILVATGWQEVCTAFHRRHPVTAERCRQSDDYIKSHLTSEACVQYKCRNGLWDLAKPIVIAGEHVATLFLGQFLYDDEEVDEGFFRSQALEFGFDPDRYLAALRRIPVFTEEKVRQIMDFYTSFVDLIVSMGLADYRQRETEKMLRGSEERYRELFEGANDAIFTIRDGAIVNCNRKTLEMFGCNEEEFIGRGPEHLSPPIQPEGTGSVARAREKLTETLAGSPQFFEWRHLRGDAAPFDAEVSLSRLEYGGETEVLAIIRDITERKRAEEALKVSEAEKALILNSTMDLIVYHATDMRVLWGNRAALDSVGLRPEELAGRNCWEIWHQHTEPCSECPVALARDTGEPQEAEIRTPDGREWYIRGFPVKDDDGKLKGIVELCLDITGRKRAEEEIEILNTNLASHAVELEAANRELEAFNYTVSHDLRSPLTGISGFCEQLLEVGGDRLDAQCLGYVRQIRDAAARMEQLTGTLLSFSRLSRCEIKQEEVDLTAIARGVAAQLRMADPCREVNFTFAEGVKATGDRKLLWVVMENLQGNAWKFTGKRETALIEFGVAEADGRPAYFVRDNGPGFDAADADMLFRPFQRLPGTTDFAGHGIGLATVQRIVQRHGGRVWALGEPGKGAIFYFTLC